MPLSGRQPSPTGMTTQHPRPSTCSTSTWAGKPPAPYICVRGRPLPWGRRPAVVVPLAEPPTLALTHHRGLPKSVPADRRGVLFPPSQTNPTPCIKVGGGCDTIQFPPFPIPQGLRCRATVETQHLAGARTQRTTVVADVIDIDWELKYIMRYSCLRFALMLSTPRDNHQRWYPSGQEGASISSIHRPDSYAFC